jgi:hypothetical protein
VIEPLEQRLRGQDPQPRRGELDRERKAVEPPADRFDRVCVLRRQLEGAPGSSRALDKQFDRRWNLERREWILPFDSDPQRRPARRDDP